MAVSLGERYADSISGFTGTATCRSEYLYGCVRICLEGSHDGQPREAWFDEQRLTATPSATSGGARPAPPARTPS